MYPGGSPFQPQRVHPSCSCGSAHQAQACMCTHQQCCHVLHMYRHGPYGRPASVEYIKFLFVLVLIACVASKTLQKICNNHFSYGMSCRLDFCGTFHIKTWLYFKSLPRFYFEVICVLSITLFQGLHSLSLTVCKNEEERPGKFHYLRCCQVDTRAGTILCIVCISLTKLVMYVLSLICSLFRSVWWCHKQNR